MRVLVCGSRNWVDQKTIETYIAGLPKDSVIIEGGCQGADWMARDAAEQCGLRVEHYPADWHKYGKSAGVIRNQKMLKDAHPDTVVAFCADLTQSRGTQDMVNRARQAGIPVQIIQGK